MPFVFSIIGLTGFFKGKIYGRHGYYIEGNVAKVIGIVMFIFDISASLCLCSASVLPSLMLYGIYILFFSVIANILILAFSFLLFSKRSEN